MSRVLDFLEFLDFLDFLDFLSVPMLSFFLRAAHAAHEFNYFQTRFPNSHLTMVFSFSHEPREYLEVRQLVFTLHLHAPREYLEVRQFVFTLPLHAPCEYLEVRHTSRNQNLTKTKSPVELRPRQGVSVNPWP